MIAYHGSQAEKDAILAQLQAHYDADEIVQGVYWERGKGCAVGCTVHDSNHRLYEPRFGIPAALAYLEDAIFEGLKNRDAKEWPLRFMRAIPVGADLSRVQWAFLHRILTDASFTPGITHPTVKDAIANVASLLHAWSIGEPIDMQSAESAAESAELAARSVTSAARSVPWSARSAYEAAWAAESAARSAAWSMDAALRSAWARSATHSAAAHSPARSSTYAKMADVLIELLEAAPIPTLV